ncbi:MAG: hypothetical protein RTU30_11670 [Candidatus Thorarchaeota archaeon]
MRWSTRKLVAIQFTFYTLGGVAAFVAWIMILNGNSAILYATIGDYITGHFMRWTSRLFLWGPIVLASGLIALISAWLILKREKIGGYLGVVAFLIGFTVDILVANVMFVHILLGLLIGWVLLAPLAFVWNDIFTE